MKEGVFEKALSGLMEQEIEKRVNQRVTKFIECISKNYDFSMKILLRDWNNIDSLEIKESAVTASDRPNAKQCASVNNNGKRCKFKGGSNGYCAKHQEQKPITKIVKTNSLSNLQHTHTLPPLYMSDCPACQNQTSRKLLIDI